MNYLFSAVNIMQLLLPQYQNCIINNVKTFKKSRPTAIHIEVKINFKKIHFNIF